MYVERIVSFNEGWSIISSQKSEEWKEVLNALVYINDKLMEELIGNVTDQQLEGGILPYYLHHMYNNILAGDFGWPDSLPSLRSRFGMEIEQKPLKNGVSASIVESNTLMSEDLLTKLYLTIPYQYNAGSLDVSIILIPTLSAINYFLDLGFKSIHVDKIPDENTCRAQIAEFSSLTSQAPVVLAFFSPNSQGEITIEEVTPLKVGGHTFERTLEFAPEYYQASVGLLSYFGEVLRQKDSTTKAKVRIEQDGSRVRLHIESPGGDIETIEKELEQYALVVSRQAEPETLLQNRAHIMQLETQLDIARIQVKQAQDLMQLAEGQYTQRINNLEQQVAFLQTQFATQILQSGQVIQLAAQQVSSHERMQAALLTHGQMLFKDLLAESRSNFQLLQAIQSLHHNLLSGLTTIDVEEQIKQALETVKQQKPGLLARIYSQVEGAAMKAGAGASLTWATGIIKPLLAHQQ